MYWCHRWGHTKFMRILDGEVRQMWQKPSHSEKVGEGCIGNDTSQFLSAPSFLKMMEQPISNKKQCCSTPPMWPSSPWYVHLRYMRWRSPCTPLVSADLPRPKGTSFPPPLGICTIFGMTCHLCSSPLLLPGLAVTLPALLRVKLEVCWRVTAKVFIVPRAK